MERLSRSTAAHRIYRLYGVLMMIRDHLEHGTGTFPGSEGEAFRADLAALSGRLSGVVSDGFLTLTNYREVELFNERLRAALPAASTERLESWLRAADECALHLSRIMRFDFIDVSEAPMAAHHAGGHISRTPKENEANTLIAILNRQTAFDSGPYDLDIQVSNLCNLRCRHCYQSVSQDFPIYTFATGLAAHASISPLLTLATEVRLGGGGEPTMSPALDFLMTSFAGKEGCATTVLTNGTMSRSLATLAKRSKFGTVGISIDGATAETVETIRSGADFEKIIATLRSLPAEDRRKCEFDVVVNRLNVDELPEVVKLAAELGLRAVRFSPMQVHNGMEWMPDMQFRPSDRGRVEERFAEAVAAGKILGVGVIGRAFNPQAAIAEGIDAKPLTELTVRLRAIPNATFKKPALEPIRRFAYLVSEAIFPETEIKMVIDLCTALGGIVSEKGLEDSDTTQLPSCGWPWTTAYLQAEGSVTPCCGPLIDTPMGNLYRNTFEEIWNGTAYQLLRRQHLGGEVKFDACVTCERGMKTSYLAKATRHVLANPGEFKGRKFEYPGEVPPAIAQLRTVKKVLGGEDT